MKKLLVMLFASGLMLAACSPYQYSAVTSNKADFSKFRTYAWLPPVDSSKNGFYNNDIAQDKIIELTDAELNARGMSMADRNPDLLVRFSTAISKETQVYNEPMYQYTYPSYYPVYRRYRGRGVIFYRYADPFPVYVGNNTQRVVVKEGTVVIDVIDRRTRKVIWRGTGEGQVDNIQTAVNDLPEVIKGIFNKYPIQKR